MTIYEDLMGVLSSVPSFRPQLADEDDQAYFARLLILMNDDSLWDKCSEEVQGWYNEQIDDTGELKKPVEAPAGFAKSKPQMKRRTIAKTSAPATESDPAAPNGKDHAADEEAAPTPLPASISNHLESVAAGETLKKAGRKKTMTLTPERPRRGRQPNPNSVITAIREEVTKDPGISPDTLRQKMLERNLPVKESTLHQTKAAHLASLRVAKAMGWTPPNTEAAA